MMEKGKEEAIVKKGPAAIVRRPEPERVIVEPLTDLFETDSGFILKLDLPGVQKETVKLTVGPGILTVQAATVYELKLESEMISDEITHKKYIREFRMGDGIDTENISARLENGVLTINLPKDEKSKAREIRIN